MLEFLLVAGGSALGGVLRYGTNLMLARVGGFPWATLAVNYVGSFVIGWVAAGNPSAQARLLLMTGVCGGFTTFSAFSLDAVGLVRDGQAAKAVAYVAASVAGCLVATALAFRMRAGAN